MAHAAPRLARVQLPPKEGPLQIAASCREEPIVFDDVRPDLCPQLEQIILDRMQRTPRRNGSLNVGGWKSGEDFFLWRDDAVQELRKVLCAQVSAGNLVGWAMVNRAGSHHPRHQHRAAVLSGVYFVTVGDENAFVPTIFECPCDPNVKGERYPLHVDPHPGRLVLCRGETWHSVPRYDGELPRITVAFDVRR